MYVMQPWRLLSRPHAGSPCTPLAISWWQSQVLVAEPAQPPQPTPLAPIAGAANLNAVDVDDAMAILREQSDASGRLDKAAFVVGLEAALGDNQTPRSRAALAALFDVVRSRTAIHAATRVPPDCVRARA